MHTQPNSGESEEFARLDGAILGLLVDPHDQRPWAEAEIVRIIGTTHSSIPDAVARLHQAGLVHRWERFVSATRAAVRFDDITQSEDLHTRDDRHLEERILELLLTPASRTRNPLSEKEMRRALGIQSKRTKLALLDALCRLQGSGLVDRKGGLAFATEAAARFDQIMTL